MVEQFDIKAIRAQRRPKQLVYKADTLQVGEGVQLRSDILRSSAKQLVYNFNRHLPGKSFMYYEKDDGTRWAVRTR